LVFSPFNHLTQLVAWEDYILHSLSSCDINHCCSLSR
jgi:hypothetical protein